MKIKFLLLIVFVFIFSLRGVNAQVNAGNDTILNCGGTATLTATVTQIQGASTYAVSSIPFAPDPFNAGTAVTLSDDAISAAFPIGFTFCFFDNSYTQFYIGSNGWVGFTMPQTTAYTSATIPSTAANVPRNCIMAPWQDWHPGTGSGGPYIRYQTLGTAPFRRLVVSYNNIPMYSCTSTLGTYQVIIYETTNVIENHIQNKPNCLSWGGGTAVQGIHNATGTVAFTVPGRNSTQWTVTNDAYRYTPSGPAAYTVNWLQGGTNIGTGTSISVTPSTTTTYTAEVTYTCTNAIFTDDVVVTASGGSSNAGNDTIVCGPIVNLSGNSPVPGTGLWAQISGPGTLNFGSSNSQNTSVSTSGFGTYEISWTITSGGCVASDTVIVTFDEPPFPSNAGPDQSICGLTVNLAGNPASAGTGTWAQSSGPGTLIFSNLNSPTSTATAPASGIYSIDWTITNGTCSTTDNVTISFDEAPTPANAGPDKTVCGQTTVLAGNTATTGTGQWVQVSGPGSLIFATPNNPGSSVSVNGSPWGYGIYTMSWTITNGVCVSADTVKITFDQPVNPADGGQDFEICGNTVPILAGIDPAIGTGQWIQLFGLDTANFSDSLFHNSAVSVNTYGQYIISWTVTNGSCSSSDTVSLVFKEPATTAVAGQSQEICGLATSMTGNIALVGQGLWTKVSGPGALAFINTTGSNSSVTASQYGTYIIKWTISNFDCISEDTLTVTFYEIPSKADAGSDTLLCNFNERTLNAVSPIVGSGKWSVSNGPAVLFDSTLNTTLAIDLQTGVNEFVWTNGNGVCPVSRDTMKIIVSEAKADFESSRYILYVDDVLQLTDLSNINPVKWSWTFADGDSSFIRNPKHAYRDTGSYNIRLLMENEYGCLDSLEKVVTVYKHLNIYVPNSFTPNGDGKNDEFKVYGDGLSEIELLIFNRWGELIFKTNDINIGWNGRKNNGSGNVLPAVYVYKLKVVDFHGTEKKQDGTITLIK